ncbi:MAG: helix-turn-helix transcriptional regulator [Clostridiales bacterium]
MSNFKDRFKLLKNEKNLSLQEISENVHISISSLSKIVNGKLSLKHDLIEELSNYFGVTKSYLIGDSENRYKEYTIEEDYIKVCEMAKNMNISSETIKKFLDLLRDVRK